MASKKPALESTDARNKIEDLSKIPIEPGQNPYEAFIKACNDDPAEIQALYDAHRTKRNEQQRAKFLSPDFDELVIDPYLLRLEDPTVEPGFVDERNCLVFWARPPNHVIELAARVQGILKAASPGAYPTLPPVPIWCYYRPIGPFSHLPFYCIPQRADVKGPKDIWLMPTHRMHMTALEITFSRTPPEIATLVEQLRPALPAITSYTYAHRSRLVRPQISYDLSAFALSFLPATPSQQRLSPQPVPPATFSPQEGVIQDEGYTYHHLRRDLFDLATKAGVEVTSRYQVPSAHITLGRYLTQREHDTPAKREAWLRAIEEANRWLETEVWDRPGAEFVGEWVVGQERGLDARNGPLWYGGGRTVMLGEGF